MTSLNLKRLSQALTVLNIMAKLRLKCVRGDITDLRLTIRSTRTEVQLVHIIIYAVLILQLINLFLTYLFN